MGVKPSDAFDAGHPKTLSGFSLRQGHQLSSENQTGQDGHANPQSKPSLSFDIQNKAAETAGQIINDYATDEALLLALLVLQLADLTSAVKRLTDGA
jgi:hypothetical protein